MSPPPSQSPRRPIRSWSPGELVSGFALLTRKETRADRNGRDYLDLQLADASGAIAAKAWADTACLTGTLEAHGFVYVEGMVQHHREQVQLVVRRLRPATEEDRAQGFDEAQLVPSAREDVAVLWTRLEAALAQVERPVLRRLVAETLAVHGEALRVHPAARSVHHAYRGGLLEHVATMATGAARLASVYPELDRDLVLVGVLFHDLGKLEELGAMPVNEYTDRGRLVGHIVLGRDLLRARIAAIPGFPADLALHLEHLVLSHQGQRDFGSPVEPMTAEAIALHFLDDLDAKLAQLRAARELSGGVQFLRPLGRHVYLDGVPDPDASAARRSDAPAPAAPALPSGEPR